MRKPIRVISHWYKVIDGLQTSALDVYTSLEAALQQRGVSDVRTSRVDWREGGVLSAKREYLRVGWARLAFDICAAPFGRGFFFSWWLTEAVSPYAGILGLVLLGAVFILLGICFAIFGFIWGFFVGVAVGLFALWGLGRVAGTDTAALEDAVLAAPLIGWLYARFFQPETFYRIDTTLMFQEVVHLAVLEVVDGLIQQQGLRALAPHERVPHLRDLGR